MGKLRHYMLVGGAALCAAATFADCEISLDSAAKPKCDDMLVTVEPHTVQSVEFMTRAAKSR